jgi:hypothetical protein
LPVKIKLVAPPLYVLTTQTHGYSDKCDQEAQILSCLNRTMHCFNNE